jgi:hypothetical protein
VRYAVDGARLVCFADDALAAVRDRAQVSVAIHQIAGGQVVAQFGAALERWAPETVGMDALVELLEHVPLGRTLQEVQVNLQQQRATRAVIALVP